MRVAKKPSPAPPSEAAPTRAEKTDDAPIWPALLDRFVVPQRGVLGRWQAIDAGMDPATFHRHMVAHGWKRGTNGLWFAPASLATYLRDCWAALVAVRLRAVLTAESVLYLVGALQRRPDRVALWARPRSHVAGLAGTRYHRGRWVAGDRIERREGLRCAAIARSYCDYAADHTEQQLVDVAAALHRLRAAWPAELAAYLDGRGPFPAKTRARAALQQLSGELVHSRTEGTARAHLRSAVLPFPLHPRPLTIMNGAVELGQVDLPFPEVRYGVEVDGPHHLLPSVIAADKARDRRLLRQADWIIDRFPVEEIDRHPQQFVAQVLAGLEAAGRRQVDPWT